MEKLNKFRRDIVQELVISPHKAVKIEKKKENEIRDFIGTSMERMGIKSSLGHA